MWSASEMAGLLGTDAKTLRRFIRSNDSTFTSVGSGGRYTFSESDLTVFKRKFPAWQEKTANRTKARKEEADVVVPITKKRTLSPEEAQAERDRAVWAEEGDVIIPDVKDPRVLAQVRACAEAREHELDRLLRAAGLHVSQMKGATRIAS